MFGSCSISDISISKESSSGSSHIFSLECTVDNSYSVTASIKGSTLSFSITNGSYGQSNSGTVTYKDSEGIPNELLAITSITAY